MAPETNRGMAPGGVLGGELVEVLIGSGGIWPSRARIVLCQHGARHRYGLAAALQQAGMLEGLCTDATAYTLLGRIACLLSRVFPGVTGPGRLAGRTVDGVPREKVFSTDAVWWSDFWARREGHRFERFVRRHRVLSQRILRHGLGKANWVYVMHDEGLDVLRAAKARGLRTAVDAFMHPQTARIIHSEHARFPDFPERMANESRVRKMEEYVVASFRLADLITCPSKWVAQGVIRSMGKTTTRVEVVPYGSVCWDGSRNVPVPGRVVFAGNAFLGKGLHYLGMAARLLRARGRGYQIRIAGPATEAVRGHALCRELSFLGKLSSVAMREELGRADVFVLPSLAEGLPAVVIEAMQRGVPVIATRFCGVQIRSGENGMLVPARDPQALATAIERVVEDPVLRARLSANGAAFAARHYTLAAWTERLNEVFLGRKGEAGIAGCVVDGGGE